MSFSIQGVKNLIESFTYAYPSARARAMKSFILTSDDFKRILEAQSMSEALENLDETPYDSILSGSRRMPELEAKINALFINDLVKISDFLPGSAKKIFKIYLERYEKENIKTVITGVRSGIGQQKIEELLLPVYINLRKSEYNKLASSKTIDEVVAILSSPIYHPALLDGYKNYERTGSIVDFNSSLDTLIYDRLYQALSTSSGSDINLLKMMIGIEIDIDNIKSIFRLVNEKTKQEDILRYLIPRGYRLNHNILMELSRSGNIEEVLSKLNRTFYSRAFSKSKEGGGSSIKLMELENALDDFFVEVGRNFNRNYPLSIAPILGYVIIKSKEVKRLISILKLKSDGFSASEIVEVLGI